MSEPRDRYAEDLRECAVTTTGQVRREQLSIEELIDLLFDELETVDKTIFEATERLSPVLRGPEESVGTAQQSPTAGSRIGEHVTEAIRRVRAQRAAVSEIIHRCEL